MGRKPKERPPRPEPTRGTDTGYDTYMWPRSKTPAKNELYAYLHLQGWRWDDVRKEWHTPEVMTHQARGRLSTNVELTEAWIHPPSQPDDSDRDDQGLRTMPEPILRLRYQKYVQGWGWTIVKEEGP